MISRIALLTLVLGVSQTLGAEAQKVGVVSDEKAVKFTIGGKPFATYNLNPRGTMPKPYMWPVRGPDGTILTRKILKSRKDGDHPHHKGIWLAVDEVNGVDFWAEKGKIVSSPNVGVPANSSSDAQKTIAVTNAWKAPDGTTVVTEETKITVYPNRVISYDITFRAGKKPVEFRDTKEGLFGFRMVNSMRESQGGKVVNSRGEKGTKNCWGKTADWVDYHGPVDGKTYGVAIFDHPKNFRKSRYHVRNYGLFSINPFGQKAYTRGKLPAQPYTIQPDGTLRLRYAMYIHAGDTNSAKVGSVYKQWVKDTSK